MAAMYTPAEIALFVDLVNRTPGNYGVSANNLELESAPRDVESRGGTEIDVTFTRRGSAPVPMVLDYTRIDATAALNAQFEDDVVFDRTVPLTADEIYEALEIAFPGLNPASLEVEAVTPTSTAKPVEVTVGAGSLNYRGSFTVYVVLPESDETDPE